MTPRGTIDFFRSTKAGAFLLFLALLSGGFAFVRGLAPQRNASQTEARAKEEKAKPQIVETISREMVAFDPPRDLALEATPTATLPEARETKAAELAPISLYADSSPREQGSDILGEDYAPFGRLVQCELVITVDSSAIRTPIVGLVTDDVWHNGRLIIPAGTEVHGSAQVDRVRERIASTGSWTLVWQGGKELTVSGMALDREKEQTGEGWGISDGSAGLRGQLLKSDDLAEVKLFAATFLSGAASALTDKQQTLLGTQIMPTLKNAPFAGAQEVLNVYAQQILSTIQRDGFYVRVAAGKQFYLYVTETIDKSKALIGGTRYENVVPEDQKSDARSKDSVAAIRTNLQHRYTPTPLPYSPIETQVNSTASKTANASMPEPPLPKR